MNSELTLGIGNDPTSGTQRPRNVADDRREAAVHRVCKALNVSLSWDVNNGPLRAKLGRIPETSNFVHLEVRNAT